MIPHPSYSLFTLDSLEEDIDDSQARFQGYNILLDAKQLNYSSIINLLSYLYWLT